MFGTIWLCWIHLSTCDFELFSPPYSRQSTQIIPPRIHHRLPELDQYMKKKTIGKQSWWFKSSQMVMFIIRVYAMLRNWLLYIKPAMHDMNPSIQPPPIMGIRNILYFAFLWERFETTRISYSVCSPLLVKIKVEINTNLMIVNKEKSYLWFIEDD